ncbi:hypothetical protein IMSAGC019_01638 [Lachnospiraceae bacterium]|nr:hypothetical protein IMSAGC019_01638 [Lachnospiraceae bacterium]
MVKKPDKFPCCQLQALVGVARYALILGQFLVAYFRPEALDPPVFQFLTPGSGLLLVFPGNPAHIPMLPVGAVRQAKLPVFIGLVFHRLNHLPQEIFRGIIKGHQNAELHLPGKGMLPLGFRLFWGGKAFGTKVFHCLALNFFVFYLGNHTPDIPAVFQPAPLPEGKVHSPAQGGGHFP